MLWFYDALILYCLSVVMFHMFQLARGMIRGDVQLAVLRGVILLQEGCRRIPHTVVLRMHLVIGVMGALFLIRAPEGSIDGGRLLEEVVVILVAEGGSTVLPDGRDGGIENDGDDAAGKTVVIQVQSRHRAAGLHHQ